MKTTKLNNTKKTKKTKKTKITTSKKIKPHKTELEYEVKFLDINHDELVNKIKSLGAILKQPNTIYRRSVFSLCDIKRGYVRVRDEVIKLHLHQKYTRIQIFQRI